MVEFGIFCMLLCSMFLYVCIRGGAKASTEQNSTLSDELEDMAYSEEMIKFKKEIEEDLRRLDVAEKEKR